MDIKINELVQEIKTLLLERGETLATAESCTGGLIASEIIREPGTSEIFAGGIIAYQNVIKENLLDVPHKTLEKYGAVSEETVKAMANGAIKKFNCQWSLATSGIAGPTGAEEGKPVGTVWMSVNNCLKNSTFCKLFLGTRTEIRVQAVYYILSKLLFLLNNQKSTCTNAH